MPNMKMPKTDALDIAAYLLALDQRRTSHQEFRIPLRSMCAICRVSCSKTSTSTRLTPGSLTSCRYKPWGVQVQLRRPSNRAVSTAQFDQPRVWHALPGRCSFTRSTSPAEAHLINFSASSTSSEATDSFFFQDSTSSHDLPPSGRIAKTCWCVGCAKRCHHSGSSPGTKQISQLTAGSVTSEPLLSTLLVRSERKSIACSSIPSLRHGPSV
jgi:hypothetical protein